MFISFPLTCSAWLAAFMLLGHKIMYNFFSVLAYIHSCSLLCALCPCLLLQKIIDVERCYVGLFSLDVSFSLGELPVNRASASC